jgi:hypothetical protein
VADPDALAEVELRLEPRPRPGIHLDLLARLPDRRLAVEIKYLVAGITTTVGGEELVLPNQGAHGVSRCDAIKDIVRRERLIADGYADEGIGLTITIEPFPTSRCWSVAFRGERPSGVDMRERLPV